MKQGLKFFLSVFLLCVYLPSTSLIAASSPEASLPENTVPAEKSTGTTQPLPTAIHIMQLLHLIPNNLGSGSSCSEYDTIMDFYPSICDDVKSFGDCSPSQACSTICNTLTTYCTDCSSSSCPNCPSNYSSFCAEGCKDVNEYPNKCQPFCDCAKIKCCSKLMQSTKSGEASRK